MAEALLSCHELADLQAEWYKIIGNNWQNAGGHADPAASPRRCA
jgi:hypothetical protein